MQAPDRRPEPRGEAVIRLISPVQGVVTAPLQMHPSRGENQANFRRRSVPPVYFQGTSEEDLSHPRPVDFYWESAGVRQDGLVYDLTVKADDGSGEKHWLRGLRQPTAHVVNLRIGVGYTWQVRARKGRRVVARSNAGEFRTHPALPRWIHVDGITNVRDLGGWDLPEGRKVRQGLFFRGSEMNSHCQISEVGKKVLVEQLGICTDIDLRGPDEDPQAVLDPRRVSYVNIPLASYDMIASPEYTRAFRALFGVLALRERYPVYVHCWGGADRTGTVAFLVGALLGMGMEDLVADYELTTLSVWGERRGDGEPFREMLSILELFAPKGSSLQAQVERYMRVIGVGDEEVAAIRAILTGD